MTRVVFYYANPSRHPAEKLRNCKTHLKAGLVLGAKAAAEATQAAKQKAVFMVDDSVVQNQKD